MAASQSAAHFLAFATQTGGLRTPETTGFIFHQMKAGGLALDRPSKASDELCSYEQRWLRAQNSSVTGSLPLLLYYGLVGRLFNNFMSRSTGELSSYTVTDGVNDKIDFNIGAGALVGNIIGGVYNTTTLGAAIVAALNSAAAGTYTCTYSTTSKKFTITRSAGTLNMNWASGPNLATSVGSLIGFTTDRTGSLTYAADEQAPAIYDHVYTPQPLAHFEGNQSNGLTILDHRDWFTYQATGCMVNSLAVAYAENDPHAPALTFGIKGCTLDRIPVVTPTFPIDIPANPDGRFTLTVEANGNTHSSFPCKNFQLQLTPAIDARWKIGDMYPVRMIHTGKFTSSAQFAWDLEDDDTSGSGTNLNEDWETVWLDGDDTAKITVTHIGETLRGGFGEGFTMVLPAMRPTGGTSQGALGTIEQPFAAMGQYDIANDDPGVAITVRSTEVVA